MADVYKLKFASLDDVLKRTFDLRAEDELEVEVKKKEAIIKIAEPKVAIQTKAPAQALLDFMDSLPEPGVGEELTDNASNVDHLLYQRDKHF